ncbi:MAG: type II secretion system protein [Sulfurovaceae bacterium]|nr:type II secretion system protein [Sulfurovaceae bacterium]
MRKAFTLIELVFVIVVIGILASIAIPRFAVTRDDAKIVSAKATIASVRSALSTERQLRTLRGDFTAITSIDNDGVADTAISTFSADKDGNSNSVLESIIPVCANNSDNGCWQDSLHYRMPGSGTVVTFTLTNGQFNCDVTEANCKKLTR